MPTGIQSDNHAPGKRLERTWYGTFLLESSDSLPIPTLLAVLRPRLLLARGTTGGIVRGSTRRQLDELHAERAAQDGLRFFKHGFECASLRAHDFVIASAETSEGAYVARPTFF